jgi:hypothetical protein
MVLAIAEPLLVFNVPRRVGIEADKVRIVGAILMEMVLSILKNQN